ncbi:protein of unknown function (plasmid) [Cupriavidus neocaledonicus]|uniref:Uncharacterized protein n=1 Tax=Cupriavidus neocaledonicus TaxID=1040979 RepID=A0A375HXK1_9BURK|nr:hypothetical protein CBM2605_P10010 [Cupriavidus neocaledonicus]SPD61997.1 protein of unknown function [Cupriavidus taiwanensis]SPD62712.1 protein of unknown function [Cupriavidus neocaledonicus]
MHVGPLAGQTKDYDLNLADEALCHWHLIHAVPSLGGS